MHVYRSLLTSTATAAKIREVVSLLRRCVALGAPSQRLVCFAGPPQGAVPAKVRKKNDRSKIGRAEVPRPFVLTSTQSERRHQVMRLVLGLNDLPLTSAPAEVSSS